MDKLSHIITCYYTLLHVSTHLFVDSHGLREAAGPAQRPGIDKVHGTAVSSPCAGVSFCKVLVVAMGSIAAAVAIAERYGPCIAGPNHRQSSEDGGDGQDVHNLLPRKGLIDQF